MHTIADYTVPAKQNTHPVAYQAPIYIFRFCFSLFVTRRSSFSLTNKTQQQKKQLKREAYFQADNVIIIIIINIIIIISNVALLCSLLLFARSARDGELGLRADRVVGRLRLQRRAQCLAVGVRDGRAVASNVRQRVRLRRHSLQHARQRQGALQRRLARSVVIVRSAQNARQQ